MTVTTHLLYNEKRGDIKIGQALFLLNSIKCLQNWFSNRLNNKNNINYCENTNLLTILTGDFNSTPNSGIYKLINDGKLDITNFNGYIVRILIKINLAFRSEKNAFRA